MRAFVVLPGTCRRQREAACRTKLLEVRKRLASAQANKLGQFQPSVPLFTSRITRCGAAGSFNRLNASMSAALVCVWSDVLTRTSVGLTPAFAIAASTA